MSAILGFLKIGHLYCEAYLEWVRSLACFFCHRAGPSEPHHHPPKKMGNAHTDDLRTVPVCRECHRRAHGDRVMSTYGMRPPIPPGEVAAAVDATFRRFWYEAPREVIAAVLTDLYAWREKRGI